MGVTRHKGTMQGAYTPICNDCGVMLCWDIGKEEYQKDINFWDSWICRECNGGQAMNRKEYYETAI
jgi:hypothetical protein